MKHTIIIYLSVLASFRIFPEIITSTLVTALLYNTIIWKQAAALIDKYILVIPINALPMQQSSCLNNLFSRIYNYNNIKPETVSTNICSGILKNGQRCSYKVKEGDFCKIHKK